jgi:hypothetical protein
MDNELNEIMKDFEQLQERLKKYLEKQGTEPYTPSPYDPWNPISPTPIEPVKNNSCPKCGIELHKVMGYVCGQPDCPTGLGTPWCTGNPNASGTVITNSEGKPRC